MIPAKYIPLILGILLISSFIATAQDSVRYIKNNDKTVGIQISRSEFDKRVSKYINLMSKWTDFQANDYIEMVRLYNTIGDSDLIQTDYYRMYYHVFTVMYLQRAHLILDLHLMKGMSLYSKKYNIWIGDRPYGNNNSIFKIDTLK
ncbi:hypothetical protein [Mucilaginibacter sp.]|uniref:hypothetical protein n=1 Tax=Mucilaginibacter sp. TaxID=1882438 RepID=UPI003D0CCED4